MSNRRASKRQNDPAPFQSDLDAANDSNGNSGGSCPQMTGSVKLRCGGGVAGERSRSAVTFTGYVR